MTDAPEIARIRAALKAYDDAGYYDLPQCDELQDACSTNSIRRVLAHIDAQAAALYALGGIVAACRDAPPAPMPGSEAESWWAGAMTSPEGVSAYIKAAFDAQAAEIERLLASLHKLASTVPASDGGGGLFFEHHGPDGEYLGCEYVDPMAVIQEMEDIARNAIGASRNAKS